jgi:pimeloyl-[acyl-carrier protein] methyl ester esterase
MRVEKIKLHLVGGWAYPATSLKPLAEALGPKADVTLHPFTASLDAIQPPDGPWWLGGWSLGGMLAMQAVIEGRLRPAGLVLISSTARFCRDDEYTCGVPASHVRSMIRALPASREKVLQEFYRLAGEDADCPFTTEELVTGLRQLETLDLRERLYDLDLPVLVLHGTIDLIIPADAADFLASNLTLGELDLLVEGQHALPVHHADWVAKKITGWVKETLKH